MGPVGPRLLAVCLCLLLAVGCGGESGKSPASSSVSSPVSSASSLPEEKSAEESSGSSEPSSRVQSSSSLAEDSSSSSASSPDSGSSSSTQPETGDENSSAAQGEGENTDASSSSLPEESEPQEEEETIDTAWFDDALFVGDSITEGIKLYDIMSNADVLSYTGINLNNIFTKEVIDKGLGDGSKETIIDASARYDPGKIYILMGINSILLSEEDFISAYERLVDTLQQQHPEATIYVQSILPVTAAYEQWSQAVTDNATIDRYNKDLRAMAMKKGVYYLNVAEVFKDDTGALYDEASPTDGIHFGPSWYRKWFEYLDTHKGVAQP